MVDSNKLRNVKKLGVPAQDTVSNLADRTGIFPETITEAFFHFQTIQEVCHTVERELGEWPQPYSDDELACSTTRKFEVIQQKLDKALEALKNDLDDEDLPHRKGVECCLAEALIHILDLGGGYELDLKGALLDKLVYDAEQGSGNRARH